MMAAERGSGESDDTSVVQGSGCWKMPPTAGVPPLELPLEPPLEPPPELLLPPSPPLPADVPWLPPPHAQPRRTDAPATTRCALIPPE